MKTKAYWILRLYTQIAALLILVGIIIARISPPKVEAPSPAADPLAFVPFIFSSVILLLPYKQSLNIVLYRVRLVVYLFISIGLLYLGGRNIVDFGLGSLDAVGSFGLILLAISAPMSLIIHRQINKPEGTL